MNLWLSKADPIIPSINTRLYYEAVMKGDPYTHSYYRHFEAPGVGHCYNGQGLYPASIFDSLVRWVERGEVPEQLIVDTSGLTGPKKGRILCPHPKKSRYRGTGDAFEVSSYYCA